MANKNNNESTFVMLALLAAGAIVLLKKKNPAIPVSPLTSSSMIVPAKPTNLLTTITDSFKKLTAGSSTVNPSATAPLAAPVEDTNLEFSDTGTTANPDMFNDYMSIIQP